MSNTAVNKGYDADYCLKASGTGYYCGGKEPPGLWWGKGAEALGLTGQVDPDQMRALYHHDVGPDGVPLDTAQRKPQYDMRTLEKRVQDAIAARLAELGDLADPEDERRIKFEERQRMRRLVPFFDITHSAEKSVSMTFAGYLAASVQAEQAGDKQTADRLAERARGIEQAVMAGAEESLKHIQAKAAYVRTGHHSAHSGQFRDADGITATRFLQHTSRDDEPQLHVHQPVLNRAQRADKQQSDDDKWRALHGTMLYRERLAMGARSTLRQAQELAKMGFALVKREDGLGYEIAGVEQETQDAFSSRRVLIKKQVAKQVADFTATYGRPPSQAEMWSIRQEVALATRKPKRKGEQSEADEAQALIAEWEHKALERNVQTLSSLPQATEQAAAAQAPAKLPTNAERKAMIRAAVAEVQTHNASWTEAQLEHEMRIQMPVLPAFGVDWVEYMLGLVRQALDGTVEDLHIIPIAPVADVVDVSPLGLRKDGTSIYRPPGERRFVTAEHLNMEQWLLESAAAKMPRLMSEDSADLAIRMYEREANRTLDPYQRRAAIGMLTSERAMDVLVAPAGTGKSWTMAAFGDAVIRVTGNRVIGLTTSENAARVLAGHGMTETYNIAKFFARRIPVGRGDVLVVDESSQVSTIDMARIRVLAADAGAYVKGIGDTEQLPSVDAGGIFKLIADDHGHWILPEVRRMNEPWERAASLRLHDGDITVLTEYRMRGRIHDGPDDVMCDNAVTGWVTDFTAGKDTLLLAASNDEAARLAKLARDRLIERGQLAGADEIELADKNHAGVGDLVRARLNTTIPAGNGQTLANRDRLRIEGYQGTGGNRKVVVVRQLEPGEWSKPFLVKEAYFTSDAELDYAGNVHVSQGRDVDTTHGVVREGMNARLFYVMATRGREANHVYTVTEPADPEGPSRREREAAERERVREAAEALRTGGLQAAIAAALPPEPEAASDKTTASWESVLVGVMRNRDQTQTAIEAMREAQEFPVHTRHLLDIKVGFWWHEVVPKIDEQITARLSPREAQRYMADPERPVLLEALRAREIAGQPIAAQLDQITERDFNGARSIAGVLHGRLGKAEAPEWGATRTWAERTPELADTEVIAEADKALDTRQAELGRQLAEKPPVWAVDAWGVPPTREQSEALRADWEARAGLVGSYREAAGVDNPDAPLGPMPKDAEVREAWFASVRALELENDEALAAAQTRGELEATRATYERARAVAPVDVSADLESLSRAKLAAEVQAEQARAAGDIDLEASAVALTDVLQWERETLNVKQAARNEWAEAHQAEKDAALAAQAELARRGHRDEPEVEADEPEAEAEAEVDEPMPGHIDPELAAQWKAEQTARVEAGKQADREKWADRIPVTDAEVDAARERDRAEASSETAELPEPNEPERETVEPVSEAEWWQQYYADHPEFNAEHADPEPEPEPEPVGRQADSEAEAESLLEQIQADAERAGRAAAALEALEAERRAEVERAGRDEPAREPELEADYEAELEM